MPKSSIYSGGSSISKRGDQPQIEMWKEKYNQSVELFSRMCKALEKFVSLKHPQTCVECNFEKNYSIVHPWVIHTHSGSFWGNVAVPTLIHFCYAPHTNVDGLFNKLPWSTRSWFCSRSCLHLFCLFFGFHFHEGGGRDGGCGRLQVPQELW